MSELRPTGFEDLINNALSQLDHLSARSHSFAHSGKRKRSLDTALLSAAALKLGLDVVSVSDEIQILSYGQKRIGFFQNMPWTLTALDRLATNHKELTKRILTAAGIPTARGAVVKDLGEAVRVFKELGMPVVVKPIKGAGGRGITVDVRTDQELAAAIDEALAYNPRVLVEECISSVDLRVMVVGGRAVAVMLRVPANVRGDGTSTIAELVARKNEGRLRNAYLKKAPLQISASTVERLRERGLSPDSVVPAGERVFLHYKANLSAGGDSYNVTDVVHPGIRGIAERAAACFPSVIHAGVDVLAERLERPPDQQRLIICEVNCNNDMPMHRFPLFGEPIDIAPTELRAYFPAVSPRPPRLRPAISRVRHKLNARYRRPESVAVEGYSRTLPLPVGWEWQILWDELRRPAEQWSTPTGGASPKEVDSNALVSALTELGLRDVRHEGRLLYANSDGRFLVLEPSRSTPFATTLAERRVALASLLASGGVAASVATTVESHQLPKALDFIRSTSGPWHVRTTRRRGNASTYRVRDEDRLKQVWPVAAKEGRRLLLTEAASGIAIQVLLVADEFKGCVVAVPACVVGDGTSTANELAIRRSAIRERHPYLRHLPLTDPRGDVESLPDGRVCAEGRPVLLAHAPYLDAGADTVGFAACPVPELVRIAKQVRGLLGDPMILAVTFAARATHPAVPVPHWSVVHAEPDPLLARFAWPYAGHALGTEIYRAVARTLLAGPQHTLAA